MATADLLSKIRGELDARLREVRQLLAEYEQLLVAAAALDGAGEDAPASPRTPRPGRVKRAATSTRERSPRASVSASAPTPVDSTPTSSPPARRRGRPPAARTSVRSVSGKPARASSKPASPRQGVAPKRAQRGAAAVAIVAALEHGSHTVSELAIVTAMSGSIINSNLRRLQQAGTIARTRREGDGKAAYALSSAPA
jgi:hypothetical protein